jgi:hypothetical protein
VRNVVFELCGSVPDFQAFVNLPSCGWFLAKYNATYWGGTPFTTLQMMRDADDVGVPNPNPNPSMPRINFKKEGLFDPTKPLFPDMIAGNYEEWTVYNHSFSTHPWHIHQNHVLITKINGITLPLPEWHDTLLVPAAQCPNGTPNAQRRAGPAGVPRGVRPVPQVVPDDPTSTCEGPPVDINLATPGSITFRVYFNPITVGCFVAHCHIIDHEDLGMMQRMDILPAAGRPSGCQLDVAVRPNLQKLLALKDGFEICTSSSPRFASRKQQYPADAEWRAPDLR